MKQHEIISPLPLLDQKGRITEEGWARQPYWDYKRSGIQASTLRIKEWDYYYVLSDDLKKGITFTISDLGYAGLIAVCWLDFETGEFHQVDTIAALTRGKIFDDYDKTGILEFEDSKIYLRFEVEEGQRRIIFRVPGGKNSMSMEGDLLLVEPDKTDSINIATSWAENRRRFYYNRKINCLPVSGTVQVGGQSFNFEPASAFGGLDWGRGAWTYVNRWYWSSASGMLDGHPFGFNLGYGFSDRSPASENILFHKGRGHKLGEVTFKFSTSDYMKPWKVLDTEGRLKLDFQPELDRYGAFNLGVIKSVQHQVFGRFSGSVILDDGTELVLQDFLGFAEDVYNRW